MQPILQTSQLKVYGCFLSTSGATYPRVPNGSVAVYFGPIILERPKSTILGIAESKVELIIIFSSFRSL